MSRAPGPLGGLPAHTFRMASPVLDALLLSDLHVGSPGFDEERLKADLAYAGANGLRLLFNGDVADLVLTRDAKRYEPSALHPRLQGEDDVVGATLDWCEELLRPYAGLVDLVTCGNHETAVTKHHSLDFTRALVKRLNQSREADVRTGGYTGLFRYEAPGRPRPRGVAPSFTVFHWHGTGGGRAGTLLGQFHSKGQWVEGADLCWFAHLHGLAVGQTRRVRLGRHGAPEPRPVWLVRTPSYLDGYRAPGYASAALYDPYPTGCVRLTWSAVTGESSVTAVSRPSVPPSLPPRVRKGRS